MIKKLTNKFFLLLVGSLVTVTGCGAGGTDTSQPSGAPTMSISPSEESPYIPKGSEKYSEVFQEAVKASRKNRLLSSESNKVYDDTTSFIIQYTYDFPDDDGNLVRIWDVLLKKSKNLVYMEGHMNDWDAMEVDVPIPGNKNIYVLNPTDASDFPFESGYEYDEINEYYVELPNWQLDRYRSSSNFTWFCEEDYIDSSYMEDNLYDINFEQLNDHEYRVVGYWTDKESGTIRTTMTGILDTSINMFTSYDKEYRNGAIFHYQVSQHGNEDLVKVPRYGVPFNEQIENTKALLDTRDLDSNFTAKIVRMGRPYQLPEGYKSEITFKKEEDKFYVHSLATTHFETVVILEFEAFFTLSENEESATYQFNDGYFNYTETDQYNFAKIGYTSFPKYLNGFKKNDSGNYVYEEMDGTITYTYTIVPGDEVIKSYTIEAINEDNTQYQYYYFEISDYGSTVVGDLPENPKPVRELVTEACENMYKPHKIKLDESLAYVYEDWIVEYDNETEGVEKIRISPTTKAEYILVHDSNNMSYFVYNQVGEGYSQSTISKTDYEELRKPYTLVVEPYLDTINSDEYRSSSISYKFTTGNFGRDGFAGRFYLNDASGSARSMDLGGTIDNPYVSCAQYNPVIEGERHWYYMRASESEGIVLPE